MCRARFAERVHVEIRQRWPGAHISTSWLHGSDIGVRGCIVKRCRRELGELLEYGGLHNCCG